MTPSQIRFEIFTEAAEPEMHVTLHGKGWTGGFRSKSVYCLEAQKR